MNNCPTCRKPVDPRLNRCPWDGTVLQGVLMDALLGSRLAGRYLVRKRVGEKGQIHLYSVEDTGTGRVLLASVLLYPSLEERAFSRFRELVQKVSSVDHPSCSSIRDCGRIPQGGVFIVEEGEVWLQLRQELVLKGRLQPSLALDLCLQMLEGLDHLHGKGLYHGALCPESLRLMFDAHGALKLQISTSEIPYRPLAPLDPESRIYVPPEGALGPAVDLYAVSLILAEMITGKGPTEVPPEAPEFGDEPKKGELFAGLKAVIERGLGRVDHRFGSAWEMRQELGALGGKSRFGRYNLLHRMAVGGMGDIYLARAVGIEGLDLNRLCVIKTVRTNLVQDNEYVDRFIAEARMLASLSHGNIVPVYDVGKVGSVFYIAMEHVKGQDLRKVLNRAAKEKRRMPVPLALFIARELSNGLAYAHRAKVQGIGGLVHRDVSPHNVLVSYDGEVKLIDFGLAQLAGELPKSEGGTVMGKVCYLSPEQARAENLDPRTDIYSAGLVLFEMLTGEPYFNQPTIAEVLAHVAKPTMQLPSSRVSGIPKEVDRICQRALSPRREDRYLSAGALRDDLTAELARLAPRTNPEEVGFFVRRLFTSEQQDEENMLSDLSQTMPPSAALAKEVSSGEGLVISGLAEGGDSNAFSLLGRSPTPIQLASTLDPIVAKLVSPSVEPRPQKPPHPLIETTLKTQALEMTAPPNRWRRNLPVLVGVTVALVGGAGVFWGLMFSQRNELREKEREIERSVIKKFAAWSVAQPGRSTRPDAGTMPREAAAKEARPGSPSKKVLGVKLLRHLTKALPAIAPCLLTIEGGQGCELFVDGVLAKQRLPLSKPLQLLPGQQHVIQVRKKGLRSYQKQLECRPGDRLKITLHVQ
jgi:serine/threonine protein kinase